MQWSSVLLCDFTMDSGMQNVGWENTTSAADLHCSLIVFQQFVNNVNFTSYTS